MRYGFAEWRLRSLCLVYVDESHFHQDLDLGYTNLLTELRTKGRTMALVIDEYGGVSGLVTIEDILEEIVGDIEDETDDDEEDFIRQVAERDFILKALTPIEDFNEYFKANFSDDEFDTIGGILTHAFGHMPIRNEVVELDGFTFRVLYADNRQIHLVRLTVPERPAV